MHTLKVNYKLVKKRIPPMPWEEYIHMAKGEYEKLLREQESDEGVFHKFFERNPSFVPGGCDLDDGSGHAPYALSLISKPGLSGSFDRIPDFLWLASYSGVFHPIFIEIEAPGKRVFNGDDSAVKSFNQAVNQIRHWKIWINEPSNIGLMKKFKLDKTYLASNKFEPKFLLIYGRRAEFVSNEMRKKLREELLGDIGKIRSYDGLTPSHKCKDCFCVKITEAGYEAIEIMPTLEICPSSADGYAMIKGKEQAIMDNRYMSKARKEFLVDRFNYWDNWIKSTPHSERGVFNGRDVE